MTTDSATIPVTGMTCAACSATVQRTLEKTPGVSSANVNLMTGSATVDFDRATTSPERLVEAIRATGYGAELPREGESAEDLLETQDHVREEEIADLRRKFAVSIAAALLTMLFSKHKTEMVDPTNALPLTVGSDVFAGAEVSDRDGHAAVALTTDARDDAFPAAS